jgi:hypothetical protein
MARKTSRARSPLLPPPPPAVTRAKLDLRDRFGLPVYAPDFLIEDAPARAARIAEVRKIAADVVKAAIANLGRRGARVLFERLLRKRSTKNKKPNPDRRRQVLAMYDQEATKTPEKTRLIAGRLGRRLHPKDPIRAESTARYIRRAVSERARATEEARRYGPTLLDAATDPDK